MEPYESQQYNAYNTHSAPRYMSSRNSNYYNYNMPMQQQQHSQQQQQYYEDCAVPPPLPPHKPKKKSMLKSPLTAIKNALIKSTRPLRRMNSMVEPERKAGKSALKRQHSLLERQMQRPYYPDEFPTYPAGFEVPYHEQPMYNQVPQQYYNTYHQSAQRYADYGTYQNLEGEEIYGNIERRHYQQVTVTTPYENEDIYANRALIDLERRQHVAMAGRNGRGIVRRHSTTTADRAGMRRPIVDIKQKIINGHQQAPNSEVMSRRRFLSPNHLNDMQDEVTELQEPVYQTRREMQREMQRNHLYQSRQEMQQRIQQGKREMEREFSTQSSSSQSERDEPLVDGENVRRQEPKESALKTRAQLREKIYQSRREAMESMAEPIYVSKREQINRPEPIYECKEEHILQSRENETDERKEEEKTDVVVEINQSEPTLSESTNTVLEQTVLPTATNLNKAPLVQSEDVDDELCVSENEEAVAEVEVAIPAAAAPLHITEVIRPPTAAPPTNSQFSLNTQASVASGVPNATSTPYTSNMSLPVAGPVNTRNHELFPPMPREPKTTRGVFDSSGGTLSDASWQVSLEIPAGAIPAGVRQEIYFTVSDPRLGEAVGGPPLDMENGLFVV